MFVSIFRRYALSKRRAAILTVVSAVLAVLFITWQLSICAGDAAVLTTVFGCVWFYKWDRDRNLIAAAKNQRLQAAEQLPGPPPMTSPESTWLGVPQSPERSF
jgi:hypothetical protein